MRINPDRRTAAGRPPWARVIVVNYNGGALLGHCIDSLARQTMGDFEVVIVDNASTDGSIETVALADRRFSVIRSRRNLGFAGGNNLGARGARSAWIATLNPDARARPDWLERLREATRRYPADGIFGSLQVAADSPDRLDGCGDVYSFLGIPWRGGFGHPAAEAPPDGVVFSPCAAAALYRRDLFEAAGGFDERFFCYLEDVDLGFRLRLRGHRCIQLRDAVVDHLGSAIAGGASAFTYYHSARNRLWVFVKNMPLPLLAVLFPLHLAATLYLAWRIRDTAQVRPMLAGCRDGLRGLGKVWKQRRAVHRARTVSPMAVARAFTWSISKLRNRDIDLRPL